MPDSQLDHPPKTLCEYFSQWEEFDETIFYDEFDAAFVGIFGEYVDFVEPRYACRNSSVIVEYRGYCLSY